jgi:predicted RNA-binding protein associated with RNAse of E/G family
VRQHQRRPQYDGLNLPIEEGDYGITETTENSWLVKHTYYSKAGSIKGTYWNINTPVEFYPDHIRYLDLHIDVVQRSGSSPRLIDQEKLEVAVVKGFISRKLAQRAYEVADSVLQGL